VVAFVQRGGAGQFPQIDRAEVAAGLLDRIADSAQISQSTCNICGPAAFLFVTAQKRLCAYTQMIIDLYEKGKARIHDLKLDPCVAFRKDSVPRGMNAADWIGMGSLRDSYNWLLEYHYSEFPVVRADMTGVPLKQEVEGLRGYTMPHDLAEWFRKAGYHHVKNHTNTFVCKDQGAARHASRLFGAGYVVCMLINAELLDYEKMNETSVFTTPNHWVVLTAADGTKDAIAIRGDAETVSLSVYTWGDYRNLPGEPFVLHDRQRVRVPSHDLSLKGFLGHFFGYVAARPFAN